MAERSAPRGPVLPLLAIVAAATGTAADAFLGTQGDLWDTQKDMLMCLIGALAHCSCLAARTTERWRIF